MPCVSYEDTEEGLRETKYELIEQVNELTDLLCSAGRAFVNNDSPPPSVQKWWLEHAQADAAKGRPWLQPTTEFREGDRVTFKPYEQEFKATVLRSIVSARGDYVMYELAVDNEQEPVYADAGAISESVQFKPYEKKTGGES